VTYIASAALKSYCTKSATQQNRFIHTESIKDLIIGFQLTIDVVARLGNRVDEMSPEQQNQGAPVDRDCSHTLVRCLYSVTPVKTRYIYQ
jgi:hypothetical protein